MTDIARLTMEEYNDEDRIRLAEMEQERRLEVLAGEIRVYSTNMLLSIIEIGRRFVEAKSLCPKGEWSIWVKDYTGYEQSMAENYIRIFNEYGGGQLNLGGDFTNSQSIAGLGVTKLLELAKIPADERLEFVESENITSDTTVKELQEKIRQRDRENVDMTEKISKLSEEAEQLRAKLNFQDGVIDGLNRQIEQLENEPTAADNADMDNMIAEAVKDTKAKLTEELQNANEDKAKLESKVAKLEEKLKKAKQSLTDEIGARSALESKLDTVSSEFIRLKKASEASGNEELTKINIIFSDIQEKIKDLNDLFEIIQNSDLQKKVINILKELLGNG